MVFDHDLDRYVQDESALAFEGVIVGARADEKALSKERYFSPRDTENSWDVGDQPPEFWSYYKTDFAPNFFENMRYLIGLN